MVKSKKKKPINKKYQKTFENIKKYSILSLVFALMMTIFNNLYMIVSLYTTECYGLYFNFFDEIYLNIVFNTLLDIVFFFLIFNIYCYVFLEMLLFPSKTKKKR